MKANESRSTKKVVVVFADRTLGGVSRSALSAGKIWKSLGMEVKFLAFLPIHPDRLARFEQIGEIETEPSSVDWNTTALVHLHHGAMSQATSNSIKRLIAVVGPQPKLPLMTKNVFAVDDKILNSWPGPRATTVPGRWTALQYAFNMGSTIKQRNAWLIPNVQDERFFRLPAPGERERARELLSLKEGDFCVLRIGSPLMAKWSRSYVRLAKEVESIAGARLLLIGSPDALSSRLRQYRSVSFLPSTSSDVQLRELYWAADSFALDSARGETFGNVVFEALLCGLPVAYRARPYRDNTPWELSGLTGFQYARSKRGWVRAAVRPSPVTGTTRERTALTYGYQNVTGRYEMVRSALEDAKPGPHQVWSNDRSWHGAVPIAAQLKVGFLHNPLGMLLKELRLRGRN